MSETRFNPLWLVSLGILVLLAGVALIRFRRTLAQYFMSYTQTWGRTWRVDHEPWGELNVFGLTMMGVVFVVIGLLIIVGSIYWALQPEKWPTVSG